MRKTDLLPRPRSLESKVAFLKRWEKSFEVRGTYGSVGKRIIAGEKAWQRAKKDSTVSIATSEGEFLIF